MASFAIIIINKKESKLIFARSFVQFTKRQLEELTVEFCKNVTQCSDLTLIEGTQCRFIFRLIEGLYIVYLSKLNSNPVTDSEVLKLVYRIICEICDEVPNEDKIKLNALDIAMALDEIVYMGLRQGYSYGGVMLNYKMIRITDEEFQKKIIANEEKERLLMIQRMKDLEKIEDEKSRQIGNKEPSFKKESNAFEHKIHLSDKFDIVKIEKPNVFKTPSGKVILVSTKEKTIKENELKQSMSLSKRHFKEIE